MPTTAPVRQRITDLANGAMLMDEREEQGGYEILPWVASGAPLFRTAEPDVPRRAAARGTPACRQAGSRIDRGAHLS